MDFLPRETIVNDLMHSFEPLMEKYILEDISVFEEEGEGDQYHMGYTVRKDDRVYMIHLPYRKNEDNQLAPVKREWVIESDAGDEPEAHGLENLDDVFEKINRGFEH
ncbi:DUF5634 family protein [Evansella clarkii]|uniref:DUF5634 family protein n=1 Tax=Evansella clarkii TaxID=79879 RepID=UPI001F486BE6|nr:DUF5634 family protein [Evansella clarkii]